MKEILEAYLTLVSFYRAQYSLDGFDDPTNLGEDSSERFDAPSFGQESESQVEKEPESLKEDTSFNTLSDISPEQEDDLT